MFIFSAAERDFQEYTRNVRDRPLANDDPTIQMVADKLREWEQLARYLQLSDATIIEIQHDYKGSYREQKFQCLKHWVMQSGMKATLFSLLKIIFYKLADKAL